MAYFEAAEPYHYYVAAPPVAPPGFAFYAAPPAPTALAAGALQLGQQLARCALPPTAHQAPMPWPGPPSAGCRRRAAAAAATAAGS